MFTVVGVTCGRPSLQWFVPFLSERMPLQGHCFCALERTRGHNTVSSRCHTDRASTLLGKDICLILQRHSVIETLLPSKLFDLLSQLGKEAYDNVPLWRAKGTHIFSIQEDFGGGDCQGICFAYHCSYVLSPGPGTWVCNINYTKENGPREADCNFPSYQMWRMTQTDSSSGTATLRVSSSDG